MLGQERFQRFFTRIVPRLALLCVAAFYLSETALAQDVPVSPREVLRLDEGWRFHKGDPASLPVTLRYDRSFDEVGTDPAEETGESLKPAAYLKLHILPTANRFIKNPSDHHPASTAPLDLNIAFADPAFDDADWRPVRLPHDWAIDGPWLEEGDHGGMGRLPSWGVGWYRRALEVSPEDKGKRISLRLDGAMSYSAVWLNGELIGGWPYGYSTFELDLTDHIDFGGPNIVSIRLDNPPKSSRWYPGGGLYRHVWLIKTDPVHIAQWGQSVTSTLNEDGTALVNLDINLTNAGRDESEIRVRNSVHRIEDGQAIADAESVIPEKVVTLGSGETQALSFRTELSKPRLWGPPPTQEPHLYELRTVLLAGDRIIDRRSQKFGVRQVEWDADQGVLINGEPVRLQGVNVHHDLGALGAVFNESALRFRLDEMVEMGVNAIRMAHNPPDPRFLDLTDEYGFLVIDELYDVWRGNKTPYDFHLIFDDWHEADLRAMIRRDRNHPSVILWSIGNEISEQYDVETSGEIASQLVALAHDEDPTRPVTAALNFSDADHPLPHTLDVINLNYQGVGVRQLPSDFPAFHAEHPQKVIISSESAAAVSSRGEYLFPVAGARSGPVRPDSGGDFETAHVSAYELHAADFGSSADKSFALHAQHPYVAGEFIWTGWDYLGEPTPFYGDRQGRSSYFGALDLAGFRKDRFYLYQSHWRPDLPMAHILPHWTWLAREGEVTPVHVFTSGDEAELFINGVSQGRQSKRPYQYRLRWDYVEYEPGTVEVVAYRNGEEWARDTIETAGPPARISLSTDKTGLPSGGDEIAFITAKIVDAQGRLVPRANTTVHFDLSGPVELVATDNGDPTNYDPFQSPSRAAFNGKLMALIRSAGGEAGNAQIVARAEGLPPATLSIRVSE